jgi:hypothetical protein
MLIAAAASAVETKVDLQVLTKVDSLMADVQARAQRSLGSSDDFVITQSMGEFEIGTLLRAGSTIPVDYEACAPASKPPVVRAPNLFPRYSLSRGVAVDFALSPDALKQLTSLGVHVNDSDAIEFTVKSPKLQTMADTQLQKVFAQPECAKLLREPQGVWLVRGYIRGQRSFLLKEVDTRKVEGGLLRLFNFSVSAGPGTRTLELTDTDETGFLQIISAVVPPAPGSGKVALASPSAPDKPAPDISRMTTEERDRWIRENPPAAGGPQLKRASLVMAVRGGGDSQQAVLRDLQSSLSTEFVTVAQRLSATRLPPTAEVRYFSDMDLGAARRLQEVVSHTHADVRLVRVQLPVPPHRFEVWLPKPGG